MMNSSKPSHRRTWACILTPFILLGSLLLGGWAGGQVCYRTLLATSTPLPSIPGARQLTTDFAFYENLAWSPSGKYLTAGRSEIMNGAVQSRLGNMVLIEIESGNTISINFQELTPYSVSYWGYFWAPDNDRLLLRVRENLPTGTTTAEQQPHLKSEHYIFTPTDNSLQMLTLPPRISALGWHRHDPNLLLVWRWASEDGAQPGVYAWYDIHSGAMRDISPGEENRWPIWLSDDGIKLLTLDLGQEGFCGDLYAHDLDVPEGFTLLQSSVCGIAWSRDGSHIAYTSYANDPQQNYRHARLMLANGAGSNSQPFFADENITGFYAIAWSPDGKQLAFSFHSGQVLEKDYATGIYLADVPAEWQQ